MNDGSTEALLEGIVRLTSARDVLDRAVLGDDTWLRSDVCRALAELVLSAGRCLERFEAMAAA